jgi:hypothetical protein
VARNLDLRESLRTIKLLEPSHIIGKRQLTVSSVRERFPRTRAHTS